MNQKVWKVDSSSLNSSGTAAKDLWIHRAHFKLKCSIRTGYKWAYDKALLIQEAKISTCLRQHSSFYSFYRGSRAKACQDHLESQVKTSAECIFLRIHGLGQFFLTSRLGLFSNSSLRSFVAKRPLSRGLTVCPSSLSSEAQTIVFALIYATLKYKKYFWLNVTVLSQFEGLN